MAYTDVCGKKLQSKLGGILNESATSHSPALLSSQQSFAKRQLEKMGWTEGTGLGKNRTGMKEHVKIKQREDEMGLGREKEMAKELGNVWWKDSVGGTLARLQQQKKKKKKDKSGDKDDKKKRKKDKKKTKKESDGNVTVKTYTDEELFAATGGARFGMRAQRRAEGKWKRTESGTELADLEEKARKNLEWNGRGDAKVLIEGKAVERKKRKISKDDEDEAKVVSPSMSDEEDNAGADDEKRTKKKRRKMEKESKKSHKISPPASEEEKDGTNDGASDKEARKEKKRNKKEKKSKKSSKKSYSET